MAYRSCIPRHVRTNEKCIQGKCAQNNNSNPRKKRTNSSRKRESQRQFKEPLRSEFSFLLHPSTVNCTARERETERESGNFLDQGLHPLVPPGAPKHKRTRKKDCFGLVVQLGSLSLPICSADYARRREGQEGKEI